MNKLERSIIENNMKILVQETHNVNNLLLSLLKRRVFSEYLYNEIDKLANENDKNQRLYEHAITRGPAAFEHLISALYETDNDKLGETLHEQRYMITDYLKIKVCESDQRADVNAAMERNKPTYKMTSKPKGYALIINMHNFYTCNGEKEFFDENYPEQVDQYTPRRFGSYRDVANMYTLLTQLGFEVTMYYDLTRDRVIEKVTKFRDKSEHSLVDSTVVVIMSHGTIIENKFAFKTYDERYVLCDDIKELFNGRYCRSLIGKPKIFLFQMCLGEVNDTGVRLGVSNDNDRSIVNGANGSGVNLHKPVSDSAVLNPAQPENYENNFGNQLVPSHSDFFEIYPAAKGTTSKRHSVKGSWLIQNVCEVFMGRAQDTHLYELVGLVREKMKECFRSDIGTQTVWSMDSAKLIFFNPGHYDNSRNVNIS